MALSSTPPSPLVPTAPSAPSALLGMGLAAAAFALLTLVDTIFKLIAVGHPAYQIIFVNGCFALIPIFIWSLVTGGLGQLRTARLGQHLIRGSISVGSGYAAILAYARLPLTDFYAIVFTGPLIVALLSSFWLGERIEPLRWIAILVGFTGILIVANPFGATSAGPYGWTGLFGRISAFVSVFCYALSAVTVRRMRSGESNMAFSFYGYVAALSISGVLLWLEGGPAMSLWDYAHLALSGTLASISSICLMTAYHRTPVSLVAPFQYTQIIWGAIAGYVIWQHVPDSHLLLGAAIVAASGLFIIYREVRMRGSS